MPLLDHVTLLHNMMRIRRMEEVCAELYTQEKIRGFLHLYIGEEAVAAGVLSLMRPQDNVMATYREHGHALLKGVSANQILAEMFGKVEGCSHGRGGSMHLFSSKNRFFGGNAIVASGIPQAAGLALAAIRLKEDRNTVCFFGEGAMAEGAFHETMNMAELWKIPLLFCCENNLYAMGTALTRSQSQLDLVKKANAYNVTATSVDGMNVLEVIDKTQMALEFIKREQRPYFLEFKTYRFRPHSMFDPELYRNKEEVLSWKEKCPIQTFQGHLLQKNLISQLQIQELAQKVEKEIQEAIAFAEQGTWEPVEDLEKHVYENDL
jgi:pyruvate dehydrogenase E1 component alpha subunit